MNTRDLQPIYIANFQGVSQSNNKNSYTNPYKIYAQVGDPKSYIGYEDVGLLKDYDRVIYVPLGDNSQYINENIIIWVDIVPDSKATNNDYVVSKIGNISNGVIPVYCKSVETNNVVLYYSNDKSTIYGIKCKYDRNSNILITRLNDYIPIEEETLVWNIKPIDIGSNKGKIRLVSKTQIGNAYKYLFKKVEK